MPWTTDGSSARRQELPPDWDQIRTRVGDRDGWRCQWPRQGRAGGICGSPANQCDHKKDRHSHRDEDLWMLCEWHHKQKTQSESAEARRAIQAKAKMPVERHPGLR